MSHTTTIKCVAINDIEALKMAVNEIRAGGVDCELVEDARPRMYYSEQGPKCPYVLKLKGGSYDVGFQQQADGSYAAVLDTFGGHVQKQVGATCAIPDTEEGRARHAIGRLSQLYAKNAAIRAAAAQGYAVEDVTVDAKGNVHLTIDA